MSIILMMRKTAGGMLRRLVLNLSKPRWRSVRVRYWSGGPLGMWNVKATMYSGLGGDKLAGCSSEDFCFVALLTTSRSL